MWIPTAVTLVATAMFYTGIIKAYAVNEVENNMLTENTQIKTKGDDTLKENAPVHNESHGTAEQTSEFKSDKDKIAKMTHYYCDDLNKRYSSNRWNLTASVHGKPYKIIVKSTERPPSRAAAAIIATLLKHKVGYNNVFTQIDKRTNCELATTVEADFSKGDELYIHVDADWKGPEDVCPPLPRCQRTWQRTCSIAGPRFEVIGATPGVNVRFHAALRSKSIPTVCQHTYNRQILEECGFLTKTESNVTKCIPLIIPPDVKVPVELNLTIIDGIELCQQRLNRSTLLQLLRCQTDNTEYQCSPGNMKTSFFFIDYDFYEDKDIVKKVHLSIQYTSDIIALRVTDHYVFKQFVPHVIDVLNKTTPSSSELRQIVELNETIQDIEKASCAWANNHTHKFESWASFDIESTILVFLCKDDPDSIKNKYKKIVDYIMHITSNSIIKLKHYYLYVNCIDKNNLPLTISRLSKERKWQWLVGIVARGPGIEVGIDANKKDVKTQMVVYDMQPMRVRLSDQAISSSGSLSLMARAISYFFKQHGWRRIAIISERTSLAEDLIRELEKTIVYREEYIEKDTNSNLQKMLTDLKESDARIIFINTGPKTAERIVCLATKLDMTLISKYAWIAREWLPTDQTSNCNKNIRIFTISYGWCGQYPMFIDAAGGNKTIYSKIENMLEEEIWPPLVTSLADAILMIVHRLSITFRVHPNLLYDFHLNNAASLMANLTKNNTGVGVTQSLEMHNYTRANPLIYVTVWNRMKIVDLAFWRGISETQEIFVLRNLTMEKYTIPKDDGSETSCMFLSSDSFTPSCDDAKWICGISGLSIGTFAIWVMIQWQKKQMKKREKDTLMRLMTRCESTASVLSQYLVERSELRLQDELGCGHFGRVRFGMLRRTNLKQRTIAVAAKALRKDAAPADEAEFLREASTLARLSHAHIIRLVGVCADSDGPPLLLMEHAFFGDLLRYLRAKRYLTETENEELDVITSGFADCDFKCADEEKSYVSAEELTRLACEAALALTYLRDSHVLHRDVRAANCLVDAKRSLKLADFGMARFVGGNTEPDNLSETETSSDYKYICRRRGVFPVPWMAPESLERGEFSHASDVWALGVLILEVATLGARPFGVWRPFRVLQFVKGGGRPPLPIDVSHYTTEVTEMCWADLPKRATAAEVYEYLRAHPTAIRPALRPAWPESENSSRASDSGFGDARADQDWTKDLRVSTM